MNAMPYWWTARCWRSQFPEDEVSRCKIDIDYLKEKYDPDKSIRYCPDLIGQRKKGRPKKDKREKGQLECVLEKSNGVRPASRRKIATEDSMIELSSGGNDNVNGTVGVV